MSKALWMVVLLLGAALTAEDTKPLAGWTATNAMSEARANSCAVSLPGNRVLVAGGTGMAGDLASVEIYSSDAAFTSAASMTVPRSHFTCTLLADGTVLAAGGASDGSGETYDPTADSWTPAANTGEARSGQTATLLVDGRVLLAGGNLDGDASSTLEIFDPLTRNITHLDSPLLQARRDHTAALLPDGTVMLIGGRNAPGPLDSVEIFDPSTGTVTSGPSLSIARSNHSATALDDQRILVAGGFDGQKDLDTAEIFDPSTAKWSFVDGRLNVARHDHFALIVPGNGGILLAGGISAGQPIGATEIFFPLDGVFVPLGPLTKPRTGIAAAPFDSGAILAAGGTNTDGPQAACGVLLLPALQFAAPTTRPSETPQVSGANFPANTVLALSLDFQGDTPGSTAGSAQNRLITSSVTTPQAASKIPTVSFPPVPVLTARFPDCGQGFRVTAKSAGKILASAVVTVKVPVTLTPASLTPSFEGLNATFTVQLSIPANPSPFSGTITANIAGDVQTAPVNSLSSSTFVSFQRSNLPAGTLIGLFTYSGDAAHEGASSRNSYLFVSRTPVMKFEITRPANPPGTGPTVDSSAPPTTLVAGIPSTFTATVTVNGPVPNPPMPTGIVTFFDRGAPLGTATLSAIKNTFGAASAQFTFTPLTTTPLVLSVGYSGDSTYRTASLAAPSRTVERAPAILTVSPPASFTCGSPTTVTATLTFPPTLGLINRTVSLFGTAGFSLGQHAPLATGSLVLSTQPGVATATLTGVLPKNLTSVSASFDGDTTVSSAVSAITPIHIDPLPVTLQFSSTPREGGVTLLAVVSPAASCGSPEPAGTVQFLEGTTTLAALALPGVTPTAITDGSSNTILPGGSQNFVSVTLARPAGPHTFVAKYLGDAFHQPATSAPITVTFQ